MYDYGKDFMSLGLPPSLFLLPRYHRNDKSLTVRIILMYRLHKYIVILPKQECIKT